MYRCILISGMVILLVLCTGCMSIVNGAASAVGAVASTTVTAAKAGGTMLSDAATGTMKYASSVWRQSSGGAAPEPIEPPMEP